MPGKLLASDAEAGLSRSGRFRARCCDGFRPAAATACISCTTLASFLQHCQGYINAGAQSVLDRYQQCQAS